MVVLLLRLRNTHFRHGPHKHNSFIPVTIKLLIDHAGFRINAGLAATQSCQSTSHIIDK